MLSKTQSKYIRSLTQQKYRKEHGTFIAEGDKIAKEWLISDAEVEMVVATADWLAANVSIVEKHNEAIVVEVEAFELEKISTLKTPNKVLLVAKKRYRRRASF